MSKWESREAERLRNSGGKRETEKENKQCCCSDDVVWLCVCGKAWKQTRMTSIEKEQEEKGEKLKERREENGGEGIDE